MVIGLEFREELNQMVLKLFNCAIMAVVLRF